MSKIPTPKNEPNLNYGPGSKERTALLSALKDVESKEHSIPIVVGGREITTEQKGTQISPHNKAVMASYSVATVAITQGAIQSSLAAKSKWEATSFQDRAAIFLKTADLISTKYRAQICASTMLGQGKNIWQAEIDAAAELCDFLRFGVHQLEHVYGQQPVEHAKGVWNSLEYRPLEGFVLAISPFNFTAIAANLIFVPLITGNVVVWKPSPGAVYSSYLVLNIMWEAGLPRDVVQFLPVPNGQETVDVVGALTAHKYFSGLHFTGSTAVFRSLWKQIALNVDRYVSYPRLVGETGGKNWHLVHASVAENEGALRNAVLQTLRGAFEYSGQKCSALGRLYVAASVWPAFQTALFSELAKVKVGSVTDPETFVGPVVSQESFDRITGLINSAVDAGAEVLYGGKGDDSTGFFVEPTVLLTKDPHSITMEREIFGPVLTVYVYEDSQYEATAHLIDSTSEYSLTGSIFAIDRAAITTASRILRQASGMLYINDKCTGAVVGQQPFGGARASGTNDKAGSANIFSRFLQIRTIKENFLGISEFGYESNLA